MRARVRVRVQVQVCVRVRVCVCAREEEEEIGFDIAARKDRKAESERESKANQYAHRPSPICDPSIQFGSDTLVAPRHPLCSIALSPPEHRSLGT